MKDLITLIIVSDKNNFKYIAFLYLQEGRQRKR
jgi:hypothetical protein